jgi:hypothetical protein
MGSRNPDHRKRTCTIIANQSEPVGDSRTVYGMSLRSALEAQRNWEIRVPKFRVTKRDSKGLHRLEAGTGSDLKLAPVAISLEKDLFRQDSSRLSAVRLSGITGIRW